MGGGAGGAGAAGSTGGSGSGGAGGTGGLVPPGPLDTQTGCAGVFNPDQILNFQLGVAPGDWAALVADTSYSLMVQARLRCNGGAEQLVGIRRKRSGGQQKVGLKIDINEFVPGQSFFGLRKLSLENGVSSGTNSDSGDVRGLLAEYLGWRLMVRSGAVSGRAALVTADRQRRVAGRVRERRAGRQDLPREPTGRRQRLAVQAQRQRGRRIQDPRDRRL